MIVGPAGFNHAAKGAAVKAVQRYWLTLSTFSGIVPFASHWWCRIHWEDDKGGYHEHSVEHGRGDARSQRFDDINKARRAGAAWVRRSATAGYVLTEGDMAVIDPQRVLSGPPEFRRLGNMLWRRFKRHHGWGCAKVDEPAVQAICDQWDALLKELAGALK